MATEPRGKAPKKDRLAFDRYDRWGLAALLVVVVGFALARWIIGPVVQWARGTALTVPFTSPVVVPELDKVGTRHTDGSYGLLLDNPTVGQRLLDLVPGVLYVAIIVACTWLVFRIMRTVAAGDAFVPANVARLRWLGGLLAFGVPVVGFAATMTAGALLSSADLGGLSPAMELSPPWFPVVAGLVAALLAEAFKAGNGLRDDVEGLI